VHRAVAMLPCVGNTDFCDPTSLILEDAKLPLFDGSCVLIADKGLLFLI